MSDGGVTGRDREEFDNNSWLHIGTLLSPLSSADQYNTGITLRPGSQPFSITLYVYDMVW